MRNIIARSTLGKLRQSLAVHVLPDVLVPDTGSTFTSKLFNPLEQRSPTPGPRTGTGPWKLAWVRLYGTAQNTTHPYASKMSKKQASLESFFVKGKRPSEETKEEETTTPKKMKAVFNRQYQESYLKYGFIAAGDCQAPSPLCTKHPALKGKPWEYFERKKQEQEGQEKLLRATTSTNVSALKASYLVANRIAKAKKSFTIGEDLILPATKDICRELLGEAAVKKMAQVPLSASTITRCIEEIADDINSQLLERSNTSPWYALQVDEFTDIENKAILLVYVRYLYQEDRHEDMLCALSLLTKTTDGAAAMTGRLSGLTARIKEVAPECEFMHCIIHREMLASRKMPPELSCLCEEMDAEHRRLLLYTEIRWLSRGRSLTRVFELQEPLQRFLSEKKSRLAAHFSDEQWVAKLAYLCDIFSALNELNLSLQGKMTTVFKLADKVAAFKAKLDRWGRRVNRGIFDMFPTLSGQLEETEPEPSCSQLMPDHLSVLLKEFDHYFPTTKDPRMTKEWVRDPFVNKPDESSLSVQEEDQLLEITNDGELKRMFETTALPVFWIKVMAEYPEIATTALKTLLPFPTSYLCETGFSAMTATKTKLRNKLDISNTLRVSLSPITPRWDRLVTQKQAQGSH
ncbi:SCAN domain-containing protein 3-like [Nothobranchius furzeri]|uniref:SCAN domain-containing protein 3-like n=1 Tax=Nothobranchius furzeri TaxID=105023 RepID=UPI003904D81E